MTSSDTAGTKEGTLSITSESDIVTARTTIREVVTDCGFGLTDATRIVTAVSELARNVYLYADEGEMRWTIRRDNDSDREWIEIVFDDDGPGIDDVDEALGEGYSTSDGMGYGLSGSQKLMDEFDIESSADHGSTVIVRKYLP